jgi:AcrR family transcriptional regulator
MKKTKKNRESKKNSLMTFSRIKNTDLVKSKQLLIAKKAAKLFIKKGYGNTTIREISKATGLAMGNLYDYIKKKEDILCLVFDVFHQIVEESSYGPEIDAIENPEEKMRTSIRNAQKNIHEFSDEVKLMYRESHLLPPKYLERAKQQEIRQIKQMAGYIQTGIKKGVFKINDPFFAASMTFCLQASLALRGWTFEGKYSRKKADKLVENYIIKSLMTEDSELCS